MDNSKLRVAILIISETAHNDPSTDTATQILSDVFTQDAPDQWTIHDTHIVPDHAADIQEKLLGWTDSGANAVNLIVTSGGTGFATRDITPEVVAPLLQRHASGLVHGMLAASLEVTPFAMMSRPVAGVRKRTIIITLPGSPKGAKENLQAVLKLLPHACRQASGEDSRQAHAGGVKNLEDEAGIVRRSSSKAKSTRRHSTHHHHDHSHAHGGGGHKIPQPHTNPEDRQIVSNDPRKAPTERHRTSPYPIVSVDEALTRILANVPAPQAQTRPLDPAPIGNILATDIKASEPLPAFKASIVDGYALIVSPAGRGSKGSWNVVSVSHAAATGASPELAVGQAARITTGAPLPHNANAVVMVEDTALKSMTEDGQEEAVIEVLADHIKPGENVREIGSDIAKGEIVLKKGEEITSVGGEVGLLASVGKSQVEVYASPVVGVLSTGDEIVDASRTGNLRLGEVRDTNRPTLKAAVSGWGYEVVDLGIAKDKPGPLEECLRAALHKVDIIITTGGVSMGELDLLKPTIERSLGGTIHFGRVAMKPGKPTTFATIPYKPVSGDRNSTPDKLIFSLPGNPASALVTAHLFVLPALEKFHGKAKPWGLPRCKVVLGVPVTCDKQRAEYHRVRLQAGEDGRLHAHSTGFQRSSRVGSLHRAQALLCLPARDGVVEKGEMCDALVMSGFDGL